MGPGCFPSRAIPLSIMFLSSPSPNPPVTLADQGLKEQKRAFNAAFYEIFRYFASDGKKGQLCFMVLS